MSYLKRIPVATYRLQLNQQFGFCATRRLVAYLKRLGISDLYISPIQKARQGSEHGYDVIDPTRLNLELGSSADFDALVKEIYLRGMGLLLDIVPNHMAVDPDNPFWMDLLEYGFFSPYAHFFDIDWESSGNRIILPILTIPYDQALRNGEFRLSLEGEVLSILYHNYRLPMDIKSYHAFLSSRFIATGLSTALNRRYQSRLDLLIHTIKRLPEFNQDIDIDPRVARQEYRNRIYAKESFHSMFYRSQELHDALLSSVQLFNEEPDPELMHTLLNQQIYKPAFWKRALEFINYRRFFDINNLIGVRVEELEVFQATHSLILEMVRRGVITGLRIDHIDGLKNPLGYLSRLHQYISSGYNGNIQKTDFYIIVEKILTGSEELHPEWPVSGTTGYEYINKMDGLFIDKEGIKELEKTYRCFTGLKTSFADISYLKKKRVMGLSFQAQVSALGRYISRLSTSASIANGFSPELMSDVIIEFTACMSIYRTYIRSMEVSQHDRHYLDSIAYEVKKRNPDIEVDAIEFIRRVLTLELPDDAKQEQKRSWLDFAMRWQQLTGAVMAKGFEDSALYCYHRLVSLNEVGGNPVSPGLSTRDFHRFNMRRLQRWPDTLNATSTHDTKRSEDVRARINVLSEIPREWDERLFKWNKHNESIKRIVNGALVPDADIEVLIYQALIGAWPLYDEDTPDFRERFKLYIIKAVREAKVHTGWISPDSEYESALTAFVDCLFKRLLEGNSFATDFRNFVDSISFYGALNSLVQVLLKITSPGIPDIYQGNELWDFSLVDPDNRRAVDFTKRNMLLNRLTSEEVNGQNGLIARLLSSWQDSRIKLYVTYKAINARNRNHELFRKGEYIPLNAAGKRKEHIIAYARCWGNRSALVVAPRLATKLVKPGVFPTGADIWGNDHLLLDGNFPDRWLNAFTGECLEVSDGRLNLSEVLGKFPLALLLDGRL